MMGPWQTFVLGLCEHLAWPVTVILCVIVFEDDIKKVLLRLKKLPGGAELTPETTETQEERKTIYDELLVKKQQKVKEKFDKVMANKISHKRSKGEKK